jgi:hypothetical protein
VGVVLLGIQLIFSGLHPSYKKKNFLMRKYPGLEA